MAALLSWRLGIGGVSGSPAPGGNAENETRKRDLYRRAASSSSPPFCSLFFIFYLLSIYVLIYLVCVFTIVVFAEHMYFFFLFTMNE